MLYSSVLLLADEIFFSTFVLPLNEAPYARAWQDFFVGGAHRLHDPRYASKPGRFKGSFLSRFGFRTETSGTVRLRLHLVEQVGRSVRGRGRVRATQFFFVFRRMQLEISWEAQEV